jgi:Tfp pilus assembly protein PilO
MIASAADIWRQRVWVWAVALAFLLLNCAGLLIYRFAYANRVKTLQTDVKEQNATLERLRADEQHRRDLLREARINRERVLQLYDESFSTRRRRLTGVTAEVMTLANRAGLAPRAISYPEQQLQQYGLIKRSFVFTVVGSYVELRKFLAMIEQSDSFLTIEDISLGEEVSRRSNSAPRIAPPLPFQLSRSAPAGRAGALGAPAGAVAPGGPAAGAPVLAPPESAPAGASLTIGMTISTLFAAQDDAADSLQPAGPAAAQGTPGSRRPAPDTAAGATPPPTPPPRPPTPLTPPTPLNGGAP